MDSNSSLAMGDEDLYPNVNWLKRKVAAWAGKQCFGIAMESDLSPEFVITNHARYRMNTRLDYPSKLNMMETVMDAWHYGKHPPETFDKDKGQQPKKRFKKLEYKYHNGYIFIFAIRDRERIWGGQKYLVTVFAWHHE